MNRIQLYFFILGVVFFGFFGPEKVQASYKRWPLKISTRYGEALFEINAPESAGAQVSWAESILKTDGLRLMNLVEYAPRDEVQIVIETDSMSANGAATVFPTDTIFLYDYPPVGPGQLGYSAHWWRILLVHEFMHILHMDQRSDFQDVISSVFGSVGKWSGLTPRWFAEGVAVWAESEITGQGRLHDSILRAQFTDLALRPGFCNSIDCLDEPGPYPFGSHGYWAGGYFVEYLEQLKPGSVKCLLHTNSGQLPFFLNNSFVECLGTKASTIYSSFVHSLRKNQNFKKRTWQSKPEIVAATYWQSFSGQAAIGDGLLTAVRKKQQLWLNFQSASGHEEKLMPKGQVDFLQAWPKENLALVYESFNQGKRDEHELAIFHASPATLRELGHAAYEWYFPHPDGRWWALSYGDLAFHLMRLPEGKLENVLGEQAEKVLDFPKLWNVRYAHWSDQGKLIVSWSTPQSTGEVLGLWDVAKNRAIVAHEFDQALERFGQCGDDIWWADEKSIYRFSSELGHFQSTLREENVLALFGQGQNEGTSFVSSTAQRPFVPRAQNFPCQKWPGQLWAPLNGKTEGKTEGQTDAQINAQTDHSSELEASVGPGKMYPGLGQYRPYYWIPKFQLSNNQGSYLGLQTSIGDPVAWTHLDLTTDYHPHVRQWDYELAPSLNFGQWYLNAQGGQEVIESPVDQYMLERNYSLTSFYNFFLNRSFFTPGLFSSKTYDNDFLGRREQTRMGAFLSAGYQAQNSAMFWQSLKNTFSFFHQRVDSDGKSSYSAGSIEQSWLFALGLNWQVQLQGQYIRLAKTSLSNGVLMGGGAHEGGAQSGASFEFLPMNYGELYGNEVRFGKLELDWEFEQIYHGTDLLPWFWRTGHLFAGAESVTTDRVFVNQTWKSDKTLSAAFGGLRTSAVFFYRVPVVFDFLYAKTLNSGIKQAQWLFLVRGGSF